MYRSDVAGKMVWWMVELSWLLMDVVRLMSQGGEERPRLSAGFMERKGNTDTAENTLTTSGLA